MRPLDGKTRIAVYCAFSNWFRLLYSELFAGHAQCLDINEGIEGAAGGMTGEAWNAFDSLHNIVPPNPVLFDHII